MSTWSRPLGSIEIILRSGTRRKIKISVPVPIIPPLPPRPLRLRQFDLTSGPKLSRDFVSSDRYRRGQIQAADLRMNRNPQIPFRPLAQQGRGEARRFAAKHQNVAKREFDFKVAPFGPFCKHPKPGGVEAFAQLVPVVDDLPIQMLPIVQTSPAKRLLVDPKSQRTDEPQLCTQGDTGPTDRSRIGWNFRLVKNDVKIRFISQISVTPFDGSSLSQSAT